MTRSSRTTQVGRPRTSAQAAVWLLAAALIAPAARAQVPEPPESALNADPSTGASKLCAPVAMPRWRSMTPVPVTWTFLDCMNFAGQMGATEFQLGCLFSNVTPHAQKFAWGPIVHIDKAALAQAQPPIPNCGW